MRTSLTSRCGLAAALLAVALCPGGAVAEEKPANPLDQRISLDMKDARLRDALGLMQGILGAELDIEPDLDGKVEISFRSLTVRTALTAMCESAGCRCELIEGAPPVLRAVRDDRLMPKDAKAPAAGGEAVPGLHRLVPVRERSTGAPAAAEPPAGAKGESRPIDLTIRVTIKVQDANVVEFLRTIATVLNVGFVGDRALDGRTVSLESVAPISDIIDEACQQAGCTWKVTETPRRLLEVEAR